MTIMLMYSFMIQQSTTTVFSFQPFVRPTATAGCTSASTSTRHEERGILVPILPRRMMMVKEITFEDFNENSDDFNDSDETDTFATQQKKLGIPILLNPMTSNDADAIKLEATEMVNDIVAAGMDELQTLRKQLNDEIQTANQQRDQTSQVQMQQAQTKLMNRIDTLTNDFLQSTATSRTTTKLAALADQSVPSGQGIELGSWGMVNGRYVTTYGGGYIGGTSRTETDGSTTTTTNESPSDQNSVTRMIVIADPSSDPYAKLILGPLETSLKNVLAASSDSSSLSSSSSSNSNTFEMVTYKPTTAIPIGNNQNAAALLIFCTSLNDVTTLQTMIDRIYRKTLTSNTADGSSTVTSPPTQIILLTTIGTTRIEKMPYSFQNLMNGNQLTKRRQMEEFIVRYVHQKAGTTTGIDYTICHLGNDIKTDTKDAFQLLPGDTLEGNGIIAVDTAVTVLTHAIAVQPYARNATFSCAGKLPVTTTTETGLFLDDVFLKLDGPELLRIDDPQLGHVAQLDVLNEYIGEWADLLCTSGKGLTTPVRCEIVSTASTSNTNNNVLPSGVLQQSSSIVRILFQPTNTGKYYVSKEDEREISSSSDGKSSSSSSKPTRSNNPRIAKEGGIEFVMEALQDNQQLRIRVKRCNYNHDTIIKELSEQTILSQFKKCIEVWKNRSS